VSAAGLNDQTSHNLFATSGIQNGQFQSFTGFNLSMERQEPRHPTPASSRASSTAPAPIADSSTIGPGPSQPNFTQPGPSGIQDVPGFTFSQGPQRPLCQTTMTLVCPQPVRSAGFEPTSASFRKRRQLSDVFGSGDLMARMEIELNLANYKFSCAMSELSRNSMDLISRELGAIQNELAVYKQRSTDQNLKIQVLESEVQKFKGSDEINILKDKVRELKDSNEKLKNESREDKKTIEKLTSELLACKKNADQVIELLKEKDKV